MRILLTNPTTMMRMFFNSSSHSRSMATHTKSAKKWNRSEIIYKRAVKANLARLGVLVCLQMYLLAHI